MTNISHNLMDAISRIDLETKGWIISSTQKLKESTPDDLINAWETGVRKGLNLKDKIVEEYFNNKVNEALSQATKLFNILNTEVNIPCKDIYFRVNDIQDFDFLYIVDFDAYLSEKLKDGFQEALKIQKECKNRELGFNFIFKPYSKNTKTDCITADGYVLKYAPKSRKS